MDRYKKLDKIGEGTYGVVYKAQDANGNLCALKKIRKASIRGVHVCVSVHTMCCTLAAIREISLLKELHHPNIVRLMDVVHTDKRLTLVFEYLEQDLKEVLDACRPAGLEPQVVKSFLYQLLKGIAYCHQHRSIFFCPPFLPSLSASLFSLPGVCDLRFFMELTSSRWKHHVPWVQTVLHRDLKPQNLLISRGGTLKLADFGLARAFGIPVRSYTHEVVTLWYRAPDVLMGSNTYSTPVDIWSIGCIFAEMVNGRPLFPGSNNEDQLQRIFKVLGTPAPTESLTGLPQWRNNFKYYPPLKWKYIAPGLSDCGLDLLSKMLVFEASERISAKKAMQHPYFDDLDPALRDTN
ncbi:cell-cycle-associated protein kinase cdk [Cyclospora cayetanensis]|uniref:Cyclin-dependent kinase 2 homolog n=1 Tax=Cyclospora cayetanensis TaxID=88456 RepID=A0A1D3D419_9EIME|nr:cell-cycle-associated protein kinase cdk [Cyclospora cayetanensis]